ncbi:MAG: methionine--tRNA ligase [Verrucomicrobiota bacterium]|nr:methionine--tRNA ligase [Limisphaera sp.]MDW8382608.1 methionine--tRNA ligase [Verrucomicrobiota bacterium]
MSKRFYITTAIDYVNGQPHLGHAYEKIVADVIARGRRSLGQEVFFLTGLDEHGQKVQQAAQSEGKAPQVYCDELARQWMAFVQKLCISNDDFVRTTQARHKSVVQALLQKLYDRGELYKAPYRGWYSWKEETFLTEKDRRPDGTFDPVWGEVTELVEDNWYFRMSRYQSWLIDYMEAHPEFVHPPSRRNEVLSFLRSQPLEDLCISRPAARLSWGIPLPFDPDYVNYVWFDALTNYFSIPAAWGDPAALSALQGYYASESSPKAALELWPADIHVIGKDIVRFHAIYWPIMLHAAGIEPPRQILVHGWWQKDGQKMSKTTGNVVDPVAVIDEWGVDAFRYYVLRELDIGPDGNWTDAGFRARYSAELANGLGNLVHRSLSMLQRYRQGVVPSVHHELAPEAERTAEEVRSCLQQSRLQPALIAIWSLITRANQYVDHTAPFKLAKDPAQATRLDQVLYNLVETVRVVAVLLWPFLPTTASRIYAQLGLETEPHRLTTARWGGLPPGHKVGAPQVLFPRKEH